MGLKSAELAESAISVCFIINFIGGYRGRIFAGGLGFLTPLELLVWQYKRIKDDDEVLCLAVMQALVAQISSSVRPADTVSHLLSSVMVTMTAETTRMKSTVELVITVSYIMWFCLLSATEQSLRTYQNDNRKCHVADIKQLVFTSFSAYFIFYLHKILDMIESTKHLKYNNVFTSISRLNVKGWYCVLRPVT